MFLLAIAHTETVERSVRLIDMRLAMTADASAFDDAHKKVGAAAERIAERITEQRRG